MILYPLGENLTKARKIMSSRIIMMMGIPTRNMMIMLRRLKRSACEYTFNDYFWLFIMNLSPDGVLLDSAQGPAVVGGPRKSNDGRGGVGWEYIHLLASTQGYIRLTHGSLCCSVRSKPKSPDTSVHWHGVNHPFDPNAPIEEDSEMKPVIPPPSGTTKWVFLLSLSWVYTRSWWCPTRYGKFWWKHTLAWPVFKFSVSIYVQWSFLTFFIINLSPDDVCSTCQSWIEWIFVWVSICSMIIFKICHEFVVWWCSTCFLKENHLDRLPVKSISCFNFVHRLNLTQLECQW